MRFVLDPGGDVEVPRGLSITDVRPALARLTGDPRLMEDELWVADRRLAGDHPAGTVPWVEGSVLSVGRPGEVDPAVRAVLAPWHLAVVQGADAGRVVCPDGDRAVLGDLSVVRRRRWPRRERWYASRPSGPWWLIQWRAKPRRTRTTVRAGQVIRAAGSSVVVRRIADLRDVTEDGDRTPPTSITPTSMTSRSVTSRSMTWLVPLLVSAGLTLATRNPVYLLFALGGPLASVVPRVTRRRRPDAQDAFARDPAATAVLRAAAALQATAVLQAAEVRETRSTWWPTALDGLAVAGPRDAVLGTVRALIGEALPVRLFLMHTPDDAAEWSWCRWLTPGPATAPERVDGPHLTVVDGPRDWPDLSRWWGTRPAGAAAIVLVPPGQSPPAWCRWVLRVAPDHPATLEAAGDAREVDAPWASFGWAEGIARAVAASTAGGGSPTADLGGPTGSAGVTSGQAERGSGGRDPDRLPDRVGLADLVGLTELVDRPEWSDVGPLRSLATPIGVGRDSTTVRVDLLADGPHALVAGTTGAGKSELLQSLVLGLALNHPPTALAMVLIDYKGGASFGACRDLPHAIGQVTDLDQAEAARALEGLRAELRHREHLLAHAGVGDLETLRARGPAPPRILVVVDEFRALADELPDFVPGLVRLAAQGRSLGIHLVLATQRPAGAVSAEMRANIALRLCLRVTETGDSIDVVDVPDAAHLPPDRPGRAILRRGPAAPVAVQTAWAALGPSAAADASGVSWAPAWPFDPPTVTSPTVDPRTADLPTAALPTVDPGELAARDDHGAVLVEAIQSAAAAARYGPPEPVWLPPLPEHLDHVPDDADDAPAGVLPFGLADLPAERRRSPAGWSTSAGPLIITGRGGSGRTTTLSALVRSALRRGWEVHAVSGAGWEGLRDHPRMGTVVGPDDPRRLARLLSLLDGPHTHGDRLLVVDDWGSVMSALDRLPRGAGAGLLEPLLRDGRHGGLAVAVAGAPSEVARLLPWAGERLVLGVADPHEDTLLGVPRELSGARGVPGRAVHLTPAGARLCQVADARGARLTAGDAASAEPDERSERNEPAGRGRDPSQPVAGGRARPLRLLPIPWYVTHGDVRQSTEGGTRGSDDDPAIGLGGDTSEAVRLDVRLGALVVGPAGSGRSTALATISAGLLAGGRRVLTVGTDRRAEVRDLTDDLRAGRLVDHDGRPPVIVIDDVDVLVRKDGELDELLAGLVGAAEAGDLSAPRVVASARTDRAAAAYRGVVAALRGSTPVLVLSPAAAGSSDVVGDDLALTVDPTRPKHPGRGTLVQQGRTIPVQVATWSRTPPAG